MPWYSSRWLWSQQQLTSSRFSFLNGFCWGFQWNQCIPRYPWMEFTQVLKYMNRELPRRGGGRLGAASRHYNPNWMYSPQEKTHVPWQPFFLLLLLGFCCFFRSVRSSLYVRYCHIVVCAARCMCVVPQIAGVADFKICVACVFPIQN